MDAYPAVQQMLEGITSELEDFTRAHETHLFPTWFPTPEFAAGSPARVLEDIKQLRIPRGRIQDTKRVDQINLLLYRLGTRNDVDQKLKIEDIANNPFNMYASSCTPVVTHPNSL
jgi:hypothetical protein